MTEPCWSGPQTTVQYDPVDSSDTFSPKTLENNFFWMGHWRNKLADNKRELCIDDIIIHQMEHMIHEYNIIQDQLAIDFERIDAQLHKKKSRFISLLMGLWKRSNDLQKKSDLRAGLFYYYYFIKNTFLPGAEDVLQKLKMKYADESCSMT